jgi:hypothetical protein
MDLKTEAEIAFKNQYPGRARAFVAWLFFDARALFVDGYTSGWSEGYAEGYAEAERESATPRVPGPATLIKQKPTPPPGSERPEWKRP